MPFTRRWLYPFHEQQHAQSLPLPLLEPLPLGVELFADSKGLCSATPILSESAPFQIL